MKEQRNQQKQVADSSMRQRDMYRILLQMAGVDLPPQGELAVVVWDEIQNYNVGFID